MPTPGWARCHVEIYEEPGFLDDCFRSSLWTKFQSAAAESFVNAGDVSGDYAIMTVTEGGTVNGAGWRRDISSLSLRATGTPGGITTTDGVQWSGPRARASVLVIEISQGMGDGQCKLEIGLEINGKEWYNSVYY